MSTKKEKEDSWIKNYWRPAIAWQYFAVCLFDFIIAPIMTGWYHFLMKTDYVAWDPLTLKVSGFYHMAMGAIIGVAAWTRGQEKITRIENEDYSQKVVERENSSQTPTEK